MPSNYEMWMESSPFMGSARRQVIPDDTFYIEEHPSHAKNVVCKRCGRETGFTPFSAGSSDWIHARDLHVGQIEGGHIYLLKGSTLPEFLKTVSALFAVWNTSDFICSTCLQEMLPTLETQRCLFCGEQSDIYIVELTKEDGSKSFVPICRQCLASDAYVSTCSDCGGLFMYGSMSHYRPHTHICRKCAASQVRCSECGSRLRSSFVTENPVNGNTICGECLRNFISRYDYVPDRYRFFHVPNESPKRYIGTEIEIEAPDGSYFDQSYPDRYKKATDAHALALELRYKWPNHLLLKHDGSLRCGFEIVSQPMSVAFHQQFEWEDVFDLIAKYGWRAMDSCGLHFHISRTAFGSTAEKRDYNISKMCLIVDALWNWLLLFVGRNQRQANRYAATYGIDATDSSFSALTKTRADSSKYHAVNLLHNRTVEIRVFQGVDTAYKFRRQLELVDCFMTLALRHSFKSLKKLTPDWLVEVASNKGYELLAKEIAESNIPFIPLPRSGCSDLEELPNPANVPPLRRVCSSPGSAAPRPVHSDNAVRRMYNYILREHMWEDTNEVNPSPLHLP